MVNTFGSRFRSFFPIIKTFEKWREFLNYIIVYLGINYTLSNYNFHSASDEYIEHLINFVRDEELILSASALQHFSYLLDANSPPRLWTLWFACLHCIPAPNLNVIWWECILVHMPDKEYPINTFADLIDVYYRRRKFPGFHTLRILSFHMPEYDSQKMIDLIDLCKPVLPLEFWKSTNKCGACRYNWFIIYSCYYTIPQQEIQKIFEELIQHTEWNNESPTGLSKVHLVSQPLLLHDRQVQGLTSHLICYYRYYCKSTS